MFNNFVDKIYVINLPSRPDRLEEFKNSSSKIGFDFQVFKAFGPKEIEEIINSNDFYKMMNINQDHYRKSAAGCFLSHLTIIKEAKEKGYKKIMILEDDCDFTENFADKFHTLFEKLPDNWDFLYLSGSLPEFVEKFDGHARVSQVFTTHSYVLNHTAYDRIIEYLSKYFLIKEVDACYTDLHKNLNSFIALPFLTYQRGSFSDIQQIYTDYGSTKEYL